MDNGMKLELYHLLYIIVATSLQHCHNLNNQEKSNITEYNVTRARDECSAVSKER